MARFDRVTPDKDGVLTLPPGRYFIDSEESDIMSVWKELERIIPRDSVEQINDSKGRGFMMVSFKFAQPVTIPRPVYLQTGFFFKLKDGEGLNDAARYLYGTTFNESRGFWEWLAEEHPSIFKAAQTTAETVVEAKSAIDRELGKTGKTLALFVAGALGVLILARLARPRPVFREEAYYE